MGDRAKAREEAPLTGKLSAEKAEKYGMVNYFVPRADLEKYTLDLAERMTAHTSWTLTMAKTQVNHAQDFGRGAAPRCNTGLSRISWAMRTGN